MADRSYKTSPWRRTALLFASLVIVAEALSGASGQDKPAKEIYQDFRNRQPLLPEFKLRGAPDAEELATPEDGGLRITLPAKRKQHWPVVVAAEFSLSGDFEITGTYELLSALKPTQGYGVGVTLNVASNDNRDTFAKIGRLIRMKEGSVHLAEYWSKTPPKGYRAPSKPTQTRRGQLRLIRKGEALYCLAADEAGKEFQEIMVVEKFGAADMEQAKFAVSDGGTPGNPVDARLIDLRIRTGTPVPDKAGPAPAPPTPVGIALPAHGDGPAASGERPAGSRAWLIVTLAVGFVITLLAMLAVGAALFLRQRRQAAAAEPGTKKGKTP